MVSKVGRGVRVIVRYGRYIITKKISIVVPVSESEVKEHGCKS